MCKNKTQYARIISFAASAIISTSFFVTSGCGSDNTNSIDSAISNSEGLPNNSAPASGSAQIEQQKSRWPVAFSLPWNDSSSGLTQQGDRLNHTPAGVYGPITVSSDGHFQVGGQPIKFWGVNITGASSFPEQDAAEAIAARLAKFGINIVRFHHMENNWGNLSLIDYSKGNSLTINPVALARLDYFISCLKARGIYININLLTSREFMVADGLPAGTSKLDWKQRHVLSFVMPEARNLEKNYAQNLLKHVNPHTGISYAKDPAIAFVEINNENGLFQQYLDGGIDLWPADLKNPLQAQWNQWLQNKYPSTSVVQQQWGAIDEPLAPSILQNGEFYSSTQNWYLEQHENAQASAVTGDFDSRFGVKVSIEKPSTAAWHVQFTQSRLSLLKDQIYTLTFYAKADTPRQISVAMQQAYAPWGTYEQKEFELGTRWQPYTLTYIAKSNDTNARLNLGGMGSTTGDIYFSQVQLQPGGELGKLPEGQTLEARTIAINTTEVRYTRQRKLDWFKFVYSLEADYWQDMRNYLKQTLGISGLPYGTIASLSPPSLQQQFGFIDAHAYWQHPRFPNRPWDPADWLIDNVSMVNTWNNTLDALANQRVSKLPFTVSEYQHSLPNSYSAEGPLLIGAYAAYQDWDAVYFFTYEADGSGHWDKGHFSSFFQTNEHPGLMANMAAAANLFRRQDVSRAKKTALLNFDTTTEMDTMVDLGRVWQLATGSLLGTPSGMAFMSGLALDTGAQPQGQKTITPYSSNGVLASDTGELTWDITTLERGFVTINTNRSKSAVGFIEKKRFSLGNLNIAIGDLELDWATMIVTAQTGSFDNLNEGATLLAVATGRIENTDMQWLDENKNSIGTHWGTAPTLIEVVPFTLELPVDSQRVQAWALDTQGQRSTPLTVKATTQGTEITASGEQDTLWYEIAIEPAR